MALEEREPRHRGRRQEGTSRSTASFGAGRSSPNDEHQRQSDDGDRHQAVSAQHPHAPRDLIERLDGMTERRVLRHEEPARHEPFTDDDAAEDDEGENGASGVDGDRGDAAGSPSSTGRQVASGPIPRRGARRPSQAKPRSVSGRRGRTRHRPSSERLFFPPSTRRAAPRPSSSARRAAARSSASPGDTGRSDSARRPWRPRGRRPIGIRCSRPRSRQSPPRRSRIDAIDIATADAPVR